MDCQNSTQTNGQGSGLHRMGKRRMASKIEVTKAYRSYPDRNLAKHSRAYRSRA